MRSLNETTQIIRDEHKKLRGLFRQVEVLNLRAPEMYKPVIDELCSEIQVYLEVEERVVFPELHRRIKEKSRGLETPDSENIHQCLSEHAEIADAIRAIRGVREKYLPRTLLDDLIALTDAHINGDERNLLPILELHFPMLDAALSMRWFDVSDEVRKRIHATNPSEPNHAQNPNGGEQGRRTG